MGNTNALSFSAIKTTVIAGNVVASAVAYSLYCASTVAIFQGCSVIDLPTSAAAAMTTAYGYVVFLSFPSIKKKLITPLSHVFTNMFLGRITNI